MSSNARMKAVSLIAVLVLTMSMAGTAYAQSNADDLGSWKPSVSVSTNASSYSGSDSITVTVTAANDVDTYTEKQGAKLESKDGLDVDMNLTVQVPDGYKVVSGSATKSVKDVAVGEKATSQVVLAKGSQASSGSTSQTGKTGDPMQMVIIALGVVVMIALLVMVVARTRNGKEVSKRIFCCILSLALVVGLSPFVAVDAFAADEKAEDYTAERNHDAQSSVTCKVDGKDMTIGVSVACDVETQAHGSSGSSDSGSQKPSDSAVENPMADIVIAGVELNESDSGYDVVMHVTSSIYQGEGTLDLSEGTVTIEEAYVADEDISPSFMGDVQITGTGSFDVTRHFSAEDAQSLESSGIDPAEQFIDVAVFDFVGHRVTVSQGTLKNAAGEAMPETSTHPIIGIDLDDLQASADSVDLMDEDTQEKSSKTAAEALKTCQETLDAIGEFVDAFTEEHGVGAGLRGCGSALGIISETITTVIDSRETYDMKDVVDNIRSLSSSIDALSGQVAQIDGHISKLDKKLAFTTNVSQIASLASNANGFRSIVSAKLETFKELAKAQDAPEVPVEEATPQEAANEEFVSGIDVSHLTSDQLNKYKKIKTSFDSLTKDEQTEIADMVAQTKSMEASLGGGTALKTALDLADCANGQSSMGVYNASNVFLSYSNYVGSFFNWESEVYTLRQAFNSKFITAFANVYILSMGQLSYEISTSTDYNDVIAKLYLYDRLTTSAKAMDTVAKSDEVTSSTTPRTDGKIKNLVNGKYFGKGFAERHFSVSSEAYDRGISDTAWVKNNNEIQFVPKSMEVSGCEILQPSKYSELQSDISVGDFNTMFDNLVAARGLKGFGGVKSIGDELKMVGLMDMSPSTEGYEDSQYRGFKWDKSAGKWEANPRSDKGTYSHFYDYGSSNTDLRVSSELQIREKKTSPYCFYISTNENPVKVTEKPSVDYEWHYTGTVVDISVTDKNNLVNDSKTLYELENFYHCFWGWYIQVRFYPAAVAKAS